MAQILVNKSFIETNANGFASKRDNFLEKAPQLVIDTILPKEATENLILLLQEDKARFDQKNMDQKASHDSRITYTKGHNPVEKALRDYKKLIDETPTVSPETKLDLGLLNESKSESTNNKKPDLKVKEVGGIPHITYTKHPLDGIILYGKINDEEYDFQTTIKTSGFDDTRPRKNPKGTEIREYYAYYIFDNKKVGKQSEVVRLVLSPTE